MAFIPKGKAKSGPKKQFTDKGELHAVEFDKAESFDLKQIILLMSNKEANVDLISKSISKKIKSIEPGVSFESSKLYKDFVDYCNKLQLIEDEYFKKQIFYYCRLLVSSDGDIHPN